MESSRSESSKNPTIIFIHLFLILGRSKDLVALRIISERSWQGLVGPLSSQQSFWFLRVATSLSPLLGGILLLIWGLKSFGQPHLRPLQRLQWFQSVAATQTPILFSRKLSVCRQQSLKSLRENWFYYFPALFLRVGWGSGVGESDFLKICIKIRKFNRFSSGLGQTYSCVFLSE